MNQDEDDRRRRRFGGYYEQHYWRVVRYVQRRNAGAPARDIAAETFLVAWRRSDQALERGLPWLLRTASLTLRNWERTQRRGERLVQRIAAEPPSAGGDPAVAHGDRQWVRDAVRQLPAKDRELLLLVTWEGLDVRDAASVVGCSPAAAAVRLHRARRRLRDLLEPHPTPDFALTAEVS
jgi:RNA polymerase sigma-70 factor (ECF subfamily)